MNPSFPGVIEGVSSTRSAAEAGLSRAAVRWLGTNTEAVNVFTRAYLCS